MAPPAYSAPSKTTDEEIGSPWLDSPVPVDPSFGTTPLTTENGGINFRAILKSVGLNPDEIIQQLGYNPSRYWTAGMSIADLILLGDMKDLGIFENLSLEDIAAKAGTSLANLSLKELLPTEFQSIASLVKALPNLGGLGVEDIPVIKDLLTQFGIKFPAGSILNDLVKDPRIGDLLLGKLDLSKYPLSSLPGLSKLPLGDLLRWMESPISGIPGLSSIPFSTLFAGLFGGGITATLDLPWGTKEARRLNTVTGSYRVGFSYPCNRTNCAYVELSGNDLVHGKQWISGQSQKVPGGTGCLRGKEPTGRHPFGSQFKMVLRRTIESEGRADFALYFPLSVPCGKRLYIIGPIPFLSFHEKDEIFLGAIDPTATIEPPDNSGSGAPTSDDVPKTEPVDPDAPAGEDECERYRGVNVSAFKRAIAEVESLGQGNYRTIGAYVCDKDGFCGRGLGRYQFTSYRPDVIAAINSVPNGANFLERVKNESLTATDLTEELAKVFPPDTQERLMDAWSKRLLNGSGGGSTREKVTTAAERHNAGEAGRSPEYGKKVAERYAASERAIERNCPDKKAICSGTFSNPAPGYPMTDRFGSCRPLGKCTRFHQGVDLGTPIGTAISVSDGGTVVSVGSRGCYGLTVDVQHCRTGRITRYAHLSSALVAAGDVVKKGQAIAKSGDSGCGSGPHLHFETHPAGAPEDPEKYVSF